MPSTTGWVLDLFPVNCRTHDHSCLLSVFSPILRNWCLVRLVMALPICSANADLLLLIKLFLFCHFLSANFRLNVHYQSIISRKYPIRNLQTEKLVSLLLSFIINLVKSLVSLFCMFSYVYCMFVRLLFIFVGYQKWWIKIHISEFFFDATVRSLQEKETQV